MQTLTWGELVHWHAMELCCPHAMSEMGTSTQGIQGTGRMRQFPNGPLLLDA